MATTAAPTLQTGRYNRYSVPFFDAGIDGGGDTRCVGPGANGTLETTADAGDRVSGNGNWIVASGNNACDTLAVAGGSDDVLINTGNPLVAPQLVCAADNGASLDAAAVG